ncbi:MAG: rsmA [Parachlamydiales bacterium]|nr:rsmA [Parachlamydiales bacterium]
MLANPNELFAFLNQIDALPKKGLSQNFLIDANIVRKIVKASAIKPGDCVLEIGPGPGALTEALLEAGAHVIAVEKDRRLANALPRLQIDKRLQVIEGDFLEIELNTLLKDLPPVKVVANLPYNITSPILERLCDHYARFSSAFLMVQKEMADRIVAKSRTKEISSFTIFLKTYSDPSIAVKVSRHCFYPEPKVDSCVIRLDFHAPLMNDPKRFTAMVRRAFQQRRKMLRSTLSIQYKEFATLRPEDLSYEQWMQLFNKISETDGSTNL